MFGASEVQMIGRYFGNTAVYNAAAATTQAVFHLASELEAACDAGARAHKQHAADAHQAAAAAQRAKTAKQQQAQAQKRKPTLHSRVSDDDIVQVLFAKVDKRAGQ
ncbi:hypothetical protein OEZ86_001649 [Tetradesmus obliquus]|nr:hypothetical protein OEZ86_001649 [Tetradesmus obliquus]